MKLQIFCLYACAVFANVSCRGNHTAATVRKSKTIKRGVNHNNPSGWGGYGVGAYGVPTTPVYGGSEQGYGEVPVQGYGGVPVQGYGGVLVQGYGGVPVQGYGVSVVQTDRPIPYPVPYDRPVPYPVGYDRPVPYPVHVDRPVPYPVHVDRLQPYPVHVDRPYPVHVDRPVPYPVHVPYKVSVPVDRPYPVQVPVPKPYPVDRPVPYAVQVPIKVPVVQPVPFEVPRPHPVIITKHVLQPQPVLWQQQSAAYPLYAWQQQRSTNLDNDKNYIGMPVYNGGNQAGYQFSPYPSGYSIGVNHALVGLGVGGKGQGQGKDVGTSINSATGNVLGTAFNIMQGLVSPGGSTTGYATRHNNYLESRTTGFNTNISK